MAASEIEPQLEGVKDAALRHTLAFGVGIHHAGLAESDRNLVEKLFVEQVRPTGIEGSYITRIK